MPSRSKLLVLTMHGFSNGGYFLILGFLSLIGSMAFWFRDVISEGRFSLKDVLCNYILKIVKAIPKEEIKQILDNYSKDTSISRAEHLPKEEFGYYLAGSTNNSCLSSLAITAPSKNLKKSSLIRKSESKTTSTDLVVFLSWKRSFQESQG